MEKVNIEDFINRHLIKVLWGVVIYFLMNLSSDFKEVKITLQQLLINQATVENRLINLEARAQKNSERLDRHDVILLDDARASQLRNNNNNNNK